MYLHGQKKTYFFCLVGYQFQPLLPSSSQYCTEIFKKFWLHILRKVLGCVGSHLGQSLIKQKNTLLCT